MMRQTDLGMYKPFQFQVHHHVHLKPRQKKAKEGTLNGVYIYDIDK